MNQDQQVGHQRVKFNTFIEVLDYYKTCPVCKSQVNFDFLYHPTRKVEYYDKDYLLIVRDAGNTQDFLRICTDGKTIDTFNPEVALQGMNHNFNFPCRATCGKCPFFHVNLKMVISLKENPYSIVEILTIAINVGLDNDDSVIVVNCHYFPPSSKLYIGEKVFKIPFVDVNFSNLSDLSDKIHNYIPFL